MRPDEENCICPHGIRPLGILYGVNMGKGRVRLGTFPGCPVHDSCHGYTARVRKKCNDESTNPAWSPGTSLWCPVHETRNCPK